MGTRAVGSLCSPFVFLVVEKGISSSLPLPSPKIAVIERVPTMDCSQAAGAMKNTETKMMETRCVGRERLGDVHNFGTGLGMKGARITHPSTKILLFIIKILFVLISSTLCHFKQELKAIFPGS